MTDQERKELAETLVHDYDFMCALRGPDVDPQHPIAHPLKSIYTARFRGLVEPALKSTCHGALRTTCDVTTGELKWLIWAAERFSIDSGSLWHYLEHVKDALAALFRHDEDIIDVLWPEYQFYLPGKLLDMFATGDYYGLHEVYRILREKEGGDEPAFFFTETWVPGHSHCQWT